ncbi:MAG: MBL fold metallo-hydrolase [Phycisphaera sp.]|nr:MAG: MBL fold metallo-hydrolase [Phycisphaera sp.]
MPSLLRHFIGTAVVLLVICSHSGVPASGLPLQLQPAMYAHFIDVGQADCTLLEFPCGVILIDAGTQSDERTAGLITQLEHFFAGRPDLDETIDTVFITHSHIDHTRALREIAERFTIHNIIDNGHATHSGGADQRWIMAEAEAGRLGINIRHVSDAEVTTLPHRRGLTDAAIDPLNCGDCDPVIRILAASYDENPGWPSGDFENENNHSLVIRVDFEESSFLFSGDLQEQSIETLVEYYQGTDTLDIDIHQVGHHGSHNATTREFLEAMTPHAAIISMGYWEFGRQPDGSVLPFSTFRYGHPRAEIVELLEEEIPGYRSRRTIAMAARGSRDFVEYTVRKRVYATGWDGTIRVRATPTRDYRITVNHQGF